MGVTLLLALAMMALLFLMIWTAALTLPWKGLADFFPQDVRRRLEPRLSSLTMSPKRLFGWVLFVAILAAMLGVFVFAGVDGLRRGYGFGDFLLRFLIIGLGVKAFDIIALDYFLLTRTHFFQHYFPETEGCAGWQDFGYNRRQQARQIVMMIVCCFASAAVFAWLV